MSAIEKIVQFLSCIREAQSSNITCIQLNLLDIKNISFNFIPDAINSGHFRLFLLSNLKSELLQLQVFI